jgi:hypothetical protein
MCRSGRMKRKLLGYGLRPNPRPKSLHQRGTLTPTGFPPIKSGVAASPFRGRNEKTQRLRLARQPTVASGTESVDAR